MNFKLPEDQQASQGVSPFVADDHINALEELFDAMQELVATYTDKQNSNVNQDMVGQLEVIAAEQLAAELKHSGGSQRVDIQRLHERITGEMDKTDYLLPDSVPIYDEGQFGLDVAA